MEAIRKFMTVTGSSIEVEELKDWQNREVELIILPQEAFPKKPERRPSGLAVDEFEMTESFFKPLPEDFLKPFN